MIFNEHSELSGRHALLSPSQYHWLGYDDQKLEARFHSHRSAQRGTDLHDLAHKAIKLGVRIYDEHPALSQYVDDAISFGMTCEQPLYYSENCFGTADTLSCRDGVLRIHDLKTGVIATSMMQLKVYAALFCLEYGVTPFDLEIELRIYQREDIRVEVPYAEEIMEIMNKIIESDSKVEGLKASYK